MATNKFIQNNRREFIGKVTGAAALIGVTSLVSPVKANSGTRLFTGTVTDPDEWFASIKGKHRMVFDCPEAEDIFPLAMPKVFLMTNGATGTPDKDCSVVVVLRHNGFVYSLNDSMWAKYKLGERSKINDPRTNTPALRNPFSQPKPDDFKLPGVGAVPLGINDLQAQGVMFCVCSVALGVQSAVTAMKMNLDPEIVKKEWFDNLVPGVQPMPSGVWAVGRAQEHGCAYCHV